MVSLRDNYVSGATAKTSMKPLETLRSSLFPGTDFGLHATMHCSKIVNVLDFFTARRCVPRGICPKQVEGKWLKQGAVQKTNLAFRPLDGRVGTLPARCPLHIKTCACVVKLLDKCSVAAPRCVFPDGDFGTWRALLLRKDRDA